MDELDPSLPRAASAYPAGSQDLDEVRGVSVDLEALFPADPADPAAIGGEEPVGVPGGLMAEGEVHGLLHRWVRGQDGLWIAIVSYRLPYADARTNNSPGIEARRVPVPAAAVRPHDGPAPRHPDTPLDAAVTHAGSPILGVVSSRANISRAGTVRFRDRPDAQGYWTTSDGRWKAKDRQVPGQPSAVTLTDTTRRATFADTGASWTRLASWDAVRAMIAAHR